MLVDSHSENHINQPNIKSNLQQIGVFSNQYLSPWLLFQCFMHLLLLDLTGPAKSDLIQWEGKCSNSSHLVEKGIHILKLDNWCLLQRFGFFLTGMKLYEPKFSIQIKDNWDMGTFFPTLINCYMGWVGTQEIGFESLIHH